MNYRWQKPILALFFLVFASCAKKELHKESTNNPEKVPYYELTFLDKVDELKSSQGEYSITAIGISGDRSHLYFQAAPGEISVYRISDSTIEHVRAKTRNGQHLNAGESVSFHKIISGPEDQALALSKEKGIMEMKGTSPEGIWFTGLTTHDVGKARVMTATAHGKSWVAFNDKNKVGGHRIFGANHTPLLQQGLKRTQVEGSVFASASNGQDLYLYQADKRNGGIIRYSGNVEDPIDNAETLIMSDDDLEIGGYKDTMPKSGVLELAVIDEYLVAGKGAEAGCPDMGVALYNLKTNTKSKPQSKEMGDTYQISPSIDNKSAFITTEKGLIFFSDGKLVPIADNDMGPQSYKRLTVEAMSSTQPIAFTNDKPNGFDFNQVSGAVQVGEYWFVGTRNNGIFKIKMDKKFK